MKPLVPLIVVTASLVGGLTIMGLATLTGAARPQTPARVSLWPPDETPAIVAAATAQTRQEHVLFPPGASWDIEVRNGTEARARLWELGVARVLAEYRLRRGRDGWEVCR